MYQSYHCMHPSKQKNNMLRFLDKMIILIQWNETLEKHRCIMIMELYFVSNQNKCVPLYLRRQFWQRVCFILFLVRCLSIRNWLHKKKCLTETRKKVRVNATLGRMKWWKIQTIFTISFFLFYRLCISNCILWMMVVVHDTLSPR